MDARTQGQIYPSDLTNAEWQWIEPLIPSEVGGGRHRDTTTHRRGRSLKPFTSSLRLTFVA